LSTGRDFQHQQSGPPDKSSQEVAEIFSDFFIEKIVIIKDSIPVMSNDFSGLRPVNAELHYFNELSQTEVCNLIKSSASKSCKLDPLPTSLLKMELDSFVPAIHHIVNKSLEDGVFPECFKDALVHPLLKNPLLENPEPKDYRPVSNLKFISKILEKAVATQLTTHLRDNGCYETHQSAYRTGHSCETALLKVHNDITRAMSERKVVALVLLDMSAAFDTVNQEILLLILEAQGVKGTVLKWLKSYLSGRQQRVCIKDATSTPRTLECGVPQGSVLGPILFNAYTSALGSIITSHLSGSGYHFYADDCQIYVSCQPSELNRAVEILEQCISDVKKWLCGHQLKLNDKKTEFMLIAPKQVAQRLDLHSATITIGSHNIQPKQAARNLGVIFDAHMSMSDHVKAVCKSAYQQLYSISKVRKCLDAKSLEIIIHSFITTKL
jgi:hypothetical protein